VDGNTIVKLTLFACAERFHEDVIAGVTQVGANGKPVASVLGKRKNLLLFVVGQVVFTV
jgi:hypothetical protein